MTVESFNVITTLESSNLYSECPNPTLRRRREQSGLLGTSTAAERTDGKP